MDAGRSLLKPQDLGKLIDCAGEPHRSVVEQGQICPGRTAAEPPGENVMRAHDHLQRLPQIHRQRGCTEVIVQSSNAAAFGRRGADMRR
jgi:hypothetical protein